MTLINLTNSKSSEQMAIKKDKIESLVIKENNNGFSVVIGITQKDMVEYICIENFDTLEKAEAFYYKTLSKINNQEK